MKQSKDDRWRSFSIEEVQAKAYKIDSLKWLKDEALDDASDLPPPEELAADVIMELHGAIKELNAIMTELGDVS